jgi:hypothetical protein
MKPIEIIQAALESYVQDCPSEAKSIDKAWRNIIKTPKVAIFVEGGIVQGVRSNIGQKLEVEIIDADNEPDKAEDYWEELQTELEFGNY